MGTTVVVALMVGVTARASAQYVPDTSFFPRIDRPAFGHERGPTVLVDEAHFNYHTAGGRYLPFATLLRRDGFVVKPLATPFSKASLAGAKILVISNALSEKNRTEWRRPTYSAFTADEVGAVVAWVKSGGSLLLIVDHFPMPGAAADLAAAFGVEFSNGATLDSLNNPMMFRRSNGSLGRHAIVTGRSSSEAIDSVRTFGGSAFRTTREFTPIFTLGPTSMSVLPLQWETFDEFDQLPRVPVGGWYQGAVRQLGAGRVAVFGEAAMFSAQLTGPNQIPMGMNHPGAAQNPQFVLNLARWLAGQ